MKKYIKKIERWLFYIIVLAFIKLLRFLSRKISIFVARALGRLLFVLAKKRRMSVLKHLKKAFGEEKSFAEINRIAKQTFLNFSVCAADAIRLPQIIENGMDKIISVSGREILDPILEKGEGAILLTAHFGNWELLGAWMAENGYKLKVVGTANRNVRIDKLITETRNNAGYYNIARSTGTRDIIRALDEGWFIGMLIDQDTKVEGVFVKFFDHWAHTAVGPIILASKYNLDVIPMFMRIKDDFTYHLEVQQPLELEFTGDKKLDLLVNTQKCSDAYEEIIRRYPEQWGWFHPRWKKQPKEKYSQNVS
ncbi:MAG: lysophospholipid acyltransferase family protein [Deltaproteobacteria bacterium]|nr:lysophospholipid acyltransferase family protein [Candidatus Tharpella sp.]